MLNAKTVSTLVVVMTTSNDLVTSIPTSCFQILIAFAFDTLGEVQLTQV
jgi:hypothetical protein